MPYVDKDGSLVEQRGFSIMAWFWGVVNFITLFVQSMINPNINQLGDKYERDYRPPGSGPPKPPSKKFGGFGPSGGGPSPPPAGGCGCGG